MKILVFTTLLFSVFFAPRVLCVQNENNSENTFDQPQGKKINVVDQIQAKAKDVFDAMPAKAMEMFGELGPMSDQTLEMMTNALGPYLKKIDAMNPGLTAKAKDAFDAMPGKVMEMLGPMSGQSSEMMDKALDQSKIIIEKTAIMIERYIKKIDELQPGTFEMVENIRNSATGAVDRLKKLIQKDEL